MENKYVFKFLIFINDFSRIIAFEKYSETEANEK